MYTLPVSRPFHPALFRLLCAMLLLLSLAGTTRADVAVIRAVWLERDARMSKPVTIVRRSIRVGELLEEAARQTGVTLTTNRYDGGDSEVITVYARAIPLVDLLSSVWSLVSYQQAAWQWEVTGDGKKVPHAYQLNCPANARELAATIHTEIQKHFEESMEASIEAISATPARAKELKIRYPEVNLSDSPLVASHIRAFASLFNKSERLKIARRENTDRIVIPHDKWTKEMETYTDASIAHIKKLCATIGREFDKPYPETLTVWGDHVEGWTTPNIWFVVGDAGWPVVGSTTMDSYWRGELQKRWMMEGDSTTDTTRESVIIPKQPGVPKLGYRPTFDHPVFRQLNEFNRLTGIPIFARDAAHFIFLPIYKESVADFIKNLRDKDQCVKWRGGALLVTRSNWINESVEHANTRFPWQVMKRFRDAMVASGDYSFTLEDVARLAHDATPAQLEAIGKDEDLLPPDMFFSTEALCEEVTRCRPMLTLLASRDALRNDLLSPRGLRVRDLPKEMRDYVEAHAPRTASPEARFRIRLDVLSPENHPDMWKGHSAAGFVMGYVYLFEVGTGQEMETVGRVTWYTRDAVALYKGRNNPELDLRLETMRTYGEPENMGRP